MKINKFLDFINESRADNIVMANIDYGITYSELDEILVDLMDDLTDIIYTVDNVEYFTHDIQKNTREYNNNNYCDNCFIISFENEKGINDENRHMSNDYLLYEEERIIQKHTPEINNKLALYNLRIKNHDFTSFDMEYYVLIEKVV